ncbi:hypothetical protein NM688_g3420 [Phlebia brevispora]|uniref:Uncharacterized protein n=1 Tax=Phlebia brevispora TaxID=194682 RepID=A0ACC1T5R3_9APHY|nr:hypothetical protein NM688_g3420 [Phlebia brevispora]
MLEPSSSTTGVQLQLHGDPFPILWHAACACDPASSVIRSALAKPVSGLSGHPTAELLPGIPHANDTRCWCLTFCVYCSSCRGRLLSPPLRGLGLVPAKRSPSVQARHFDAWRRDIVPRGDVRLNYATATYHPPSAFVSFSAHEDRPILLVEDMDELLDDVRCVEDGNLAKHTMHLTFASEEAFAEALYTWAAFESFAVVTSHPTCNPDYERGAWMVDQFTPDPRTLTIALHARPAEWTSLGRSCHVKYDHNGYGVWDLREHAQAPVVKRQNVVDDNIYTFGTSPDYSRIPLYPPNSTLAPNATDLDGLNIQLTCVDCTLKSNFSIGVDFEIDLTNTSCVPSFTQNCFGLTVANMNFTVVDLEQDANLEIFLGDQFTHSGNYTVFRFPLEPGFQFADLVNIGPSLGIDLNWGFDASASINFTYGASAQFAKGAFASLDLLNSGAEWDPSFSATGWDNFSFNQIPFRLNSGQLSLNTTVALAPFAEVAFTILEVGASTHLTTNMPQVNVDAALVTNVDRQCNPIGPETFESFSLAFEVGASMDFSAAAHFEVDEGIFDPSTGIPSEYDQTLFDKEVPLAPTNGNQTECFIIVDDQPSNSTNSTTSTVTGVPASTGTLMSAASAVPTWNFTKIQSYFSANGQLPTGVNYTQMVQATVVPSALQQAVNQTVFNSTSAANKTTTGGNTTTTGGGTGGGTSDGYDYGECGTGACFNLVMATLAGKKIVVIGGSSGIGYAVAKASLLSLADHVLIASSSAAKVETAVSRLLAEPDLQKLQPGLQARLSGDTLDLADTGAVRAFFAKIGEIDHLIITSGGISLQIDFRSEDLDKYKDAFDMRFWGAAVAAQSAKIRDGGSITFTIGGALLKPRRNWSLIIGTLGAVDSLTRSLAVELAPIRVNVVCPGAVNTELWDGFPKEVKDKMLADAAAALPVKHVAGPEEIAETYLFLMKCNYITGQRIEVDGGGRLI